MTDHDIIERAESAIEYADKYGLVASDLSTRVLRDLLALAERNQRKAEAWDMVDKAMYGPIGMTKAEFRLARAHAEKSDG